MKKIKYITFAAVILSFLLFTACSTTQNIPQDDVYYSTSPHNPVATVKTTTTVSPSGSKTSAPAYREGAVEKVNLSSGQTTSAGDNYDVDYSARLKKFHQAGDTSLNENYTTDSITRTSQKTGQTTVTTTTNVSLGLGFDSPYFGSSWSFDFGSPLWGYGWGYPFYGWNYPYYNSYYAWGVPYYGWDYPYFGGFYPYFGYSPYYYDDCYSCYYPLGGAYGYGRSIYGHRARRGGGSFVPRSSVSGGIALFGHQKASPGVNGSRTGTSVSQKRVPITPRGQKGQIAKPGSVNTRPVGSMRYRSELVKQQQELLQRQGKLAKPTGGTINRGNRSGNRNAQSGISESRNRGAEGYRNPPAFRREETLPKPRFQKPKQYQSLESQSMRSSKEFYRPPTRPANPGYRRSNVNSSRPASNYVRPASKNYVTPARKYPVRRQNIYRPTNSRNAVYRSPRSRSGVKVYKAPTRSFSSPNVFRSTYRRSGTSAPVRNISVPMRNISAPVRTNSGSGGGGIRSSGSGGGIRK
jgi:hypothetical protein